MSDTLVSLFVAAGVAGMAYTRLGRRVGYGNTQYVWIIEGVVFVLVFLFMWTLLRYVIHLH